MSEKKYLPDSVYSYDELISVFDDFHVDSEKTRFFVDRRYERPKAYVIYRDDNGEFEVYKMKADGSKAVRYRGLNERKAVDEFYSKFISEVSKRPEFARKLLRTDNRTRSVSRQSSDTWIAVAFPLAIGGMFVLTVLKFISYWLIPIVGLLMGILVFAYTSGRDYVVLKRILIAAIVLILIGGISYSTYRKASHRKDGYYITDDGAYYRQGRKYYYYDDGYWTYYGDYYLFDQYYDYYDYQYYDSYFYNDYFDDFYYSDYYEDDYYYDDDSYWDDDSDWDDDSGWDDDDDWDTWDSDFDSDWDSDW